MKDSKFKFERAIDLIKKSPLIYNIALLSSFIVVILYLLAPNDADLSVFPSLSASRFLWTPLIPILTALAVMIWTKLSLEEKLDEKRSIIASLLVPFLVFLAIQFSVNSPLGVDGWLFFENARYFSSFGTSGRLPYDSHPLVMIPVDLAIRLLGTSGVGAATISGLLISVIWLVTIIRATKSSPNFSRNGVLILSGVSLFFVITGWNPLRYTAHSLALMMGHILIHKTNERVNYWDLLLVGLLSLSHSFAPIVFGAILFLDSFLRTTSSMRKRILGFVLCLCYIVWNSTHSLDRFSKYLLIDNPDTLELIIILSLPSVIVFAMSVMYENKLGSRNIAIFGSGTGVSNISILLGCLCCIPILYFGELELGQRRFIHRLITYSIVPLMWSAGYIIDKIILQIPSTVQEFGHSEFSEKIKVIIVAISILNGIGCGILQTRNAENMEAMPSSVSECWDLVEESGILAPMYNQRGRFVLISDQTQPPLSGSGFWDFKKHGDGSQIPDLNSENIWAIVETPDFFDKLNGTTNHDFTNFFMISQIENSCRIWVNPEFMNKLDPAINWHHLESISGI